MLNVELKRRKNYIRNSKTIIFVTPDTELSTKTRKSCDFSEDIFLLTSLRRRYPSKLMTTKVNFSHVCDILFVYFLSKFSLNFFC